MGFLLSWLNPLMSSGSRKPLGEDDLYKPLLCEKTDFLLKKLEEYGLLNRNFDKILKSFLSKTLSSWKKELLKSKPSLTRAILNEYWPKFFIVTVAVCLKVKQRKVFKTFSSFKYFGFSNFQKESMSIVMPMFLSFLLEYFNGTRNMTWAFVFGALTCLSMFVQTVTHHPQMFFMYRYGMQIRVAICGLVYKKVLLK
jgi:hypothetical protein